MNEIQTYIKKFKSIVLLLLFILFLFGVIIKQVVPIVSDIYKTTNEYSQAVVSLADKERTRDNLKAKTEAAEAENNNAIKAFYKPIEQGMDAETVIASEFAEILTLIRNNTIKTRSIKYEYDPKDDNFVKNVPDKYNVAKLDIEMIANYKNFESFLKELYKHEHFLDIASFEIIPYEKDKKILLINLQIKLYAQK